MMGENETDQAVSRAMRRAAEIVEMLPGDTYDERVSLLAYAYALGNRDGFAEGAAAAEQAFAEVNAKLREALQR